MHTDTEGYGSTIWHTKEIPVWGRIYFSIEEEKKKSSSVNAEKEVIYTGIWVWFSILSNWCNCIVFSGITLAWNWCNRVEKNVISKDHLRLNSGLSCTTLNLEQFHWIHWLLFLTPVQLRAETVNPKQFHWIQWLLFFFTPVQMRAESGPFCICIGSGHASHASVEGIGYYGWLKSERIYTFRTIRHSELMCPNQMVRDGFCHWQIYYHSVSQVFPKQCCEKGSESQNAFSLVMLLEKYLLPNQCAA